MPHNKYSGITDQTRLESPQPEASQPIVPATECRSEPTQRPPVPLSVDQPLAILLLDNPAHPDNLMFRQAQAQVYALDARFDRTPDERSDNLAAALTVQAKTLELRGIHALVLSDDNSKIFVMDDANFENIFKRYASVDIVPAMNQSVAHSTQHIALVNASLEQKVQAEHLTQQTSQPSPKLHHGHCMG